jgi:hypothetical protein
MAQPIPDLLLLHAPHVCDTRELFARPRLSKFRVAKVPRVLGRQLPGFDAA